MINLKDSEFETKRHPMQPNKDGYCGNAIIFVMAETTQGIRSGALCERENLEKIAGELSLKPFVFMNKSNREIQMALAYIANPPDIRPVYVPEDVWQARILPEHKVILVVVSSHGNSDSFLTADGNLFLDKAIDKYYLNDTYCPLMRGKPKILLFNKCRTEGEDVYETPSTQPDSISPMLDSIRMRGHEDSFKASSTFSDFLHIYTCSMSTPSLRNTTTGSLILSALPDEYKLYGRGKEFRKFIQIFRSRMIMEVNKKVQDDPKLANATQCITAESDSLLGDIYFPQTGSMAGLSDCESLEDMEVEYAGEFENRHYEEMDSECVCEEREPKIKHIKPRFLSRMKLYKKAHHTFRPGGHKSRIRRFFSLS